jgi:hypothetical protein
LFWSQKKAQFFAIMKKELNPVEGKVIIKWSFLTFKVTNFKAT